MRGLHIFKAGCHTAAAGQHICFSADDINDTAAVYSPGLRRAPLVLGHPKDDDPAHGWVAALQAAGSNLVAYVENVSEKLQGDVKAKRYRNISASFYPPQHPKNPTPGKYYLRHVGFLGAVPPAVTDLREPEPEALAYSELPLQCVHEFSGQPFSAPQHYSTDQERLKLHNQAVEFMELNPGTDYVTAVMTIEQGDSD